MTKDQELMKRIREHMERKGAAGAAAAMNSTLATATVNEIFNAPIDARWQRDPYPIEYWEPAAQARIPKKTDHYFSPELLDKLLFAMKAGKTCLLHGPTGTGKTSNIKELAARLNMPFWRVSCHAQMEASEFLGSVSVVAENGVPVTKTAPSDVVLAFMHGGILTIDEAFRAPNLMAIQSVLESPPTLVLQDAHGVQRALEPTKDLWIFLTDNTTGTGDTTGKYIAQVQDVSSLDRITTSIFVDYLSETEEVNILKEVFKDKFEESVAKQMVIVAGLIRPAFTQNKVLQTMSIRGLINWYRNYTLIGHVGPAYRLAYLDKLGDTCKQVAIDCYRQVYGVYP
jgi:cobaltochelatase CobS